MLDEILQGKRLEKYVPLIGWITSYQRAWLRDDLVSGVVVGAIMVPVAMAYAQMAGVPPQQASVESQKSPVMRQPPATLQTVTPLPGSWQRREQQPEELSQGLPPCVQPPFPSRQRPAIEERLERSQKLEQQSLFSKQTSPVALQV